MHLEVGQHGDFRFGHLLAHGPPEPLRDPEGWQKSPRRFDRRFGFAPGIGHFRVAQHQGNAFQKPLDKTSLDLGKAFGVSFGNWLVMIPIAGFALDKIGVPALAQGVLSDRIRDYFGNNEPRVVQPQVIEERRGAKPNAHRALRQQFQQMPPHLPEGNRGDHPGGAAERGERIQPSQRAARKKLARANLACLEVNFQNPLLLGLQRQLEEIPMLPLVEFHEVVRK